MDQGDRQRLEKKWNELCVQFLPVTDGDSIWRYSRTRQESDAAQGWKLHISTTVLNAPQILERVGSPLSKCGVQFKAPRSLTDIVALNSGLLHTYSQVGKSITVYPRSDHEAVSLAQILHQLTYRFKCPTVPFDLRFGEHSNIYYRYGAFTRIEFEQPDGTRTLAMTSPAGELMSDSRERPKPDWATDPFAGTPTKKSRDQQRNRLPSIHVLRALVQRGKGGVYQAIDLQSNPPRLCLLKEGRRHGELGWDGRDGAWRVRHEERVLAHLSAAGISVPRIYSRFECERNFYLVMEFIEGESLHTLLGKRKKRLTINRLLSIGVRLADLLAQMHRAGWAWRDCKPQNLIVKSDGGLMPIDFEGAEHINRPDWSLWGTPGFVPHRSSRLSTVSGLTDLYALGSILYLLISGRMFDDQKPVSIARLRRNVPLELQSLVKSLLDENPHHRPTAQSAHLQLTAILRKLSDHRACLAQARAA